MELFCKLFCSCFVIVLYVSWICWYFLPELFSLYKTHMCNRCGEALSPWSPTTIQWRSRREGHAAPAMPVLSTASSALVVHVHTAAKTRDALDKSVGGAPILQGTAVGFSRGCGVDIQVTHVSKDMFDHRGKMYWAGRCEMWLDSRIDHGRCSLRGSTLPSARWLGWDAQATKHVPLTTKTRLQPLTCPHRNRHSCGLPGPTHGRGHALFCQRLSSSCRLVVGRLLVAPVLKKMLRIPTPMCKKRL